MIVVVTGSSASSGESLWPAARQAMRRRGAVLGLLRCFGRAVLFDRSADLRHDIGAGPLGHGEPSIRDLTCAPDGERLRTQHIVSKTYAPSGAADSSEPIVTAAFKQASWARRG
jgi:hypothetical protein